MPITWWRRRSQEPLPEPWFPELTAELKRTPSKAQIQYAYIGHAKICPITPRHNWCSLRRQLAKHRDYTH